MTHPLPDAPKPDTGPTGEAFRARPSRMHTPRATTVSTVAPGRVTEVVRMQDTHLIDRMWACSQLSDRQHRAATALYTIWTRAGLNPKGTMGLNPIGDSVGDGDDDPPSLSSRADHLTLREGESWRDRHRSIMKGLAGRTAALLDGLMCGQHPGVAWLASAQMGLDELADSWGIERT